MINIRNLKKDKRGTTVIEFAIIAPTFLLLLLGAFDIGHTVYLRGILQGAVLEAARDSTLETANVEQAAIDALVEERVNTVAPSVEMSFNRKSYFEFTDVNRPEAFEDEVDPDTGEKNGIYDEGECYSDENGNGQWDDDVGTAGMGGPNDIVLYTVTAEYESLFPFAKMLGRDTTKSISAETVLRNQPYGPEATATVVARDCD